MVRSFLTYYRLLLRHLSLVLVCVGPSAFADTEHFAQEASSRITRVQEFEYIRREAEKLGIKAYLFGGTAASYAHYVKQDLAREAGDSRYPNHLFDYDYTKIFRSTQDLDIAIDGTPDQAVTLESMLKNKFPHFIGDKGAQWEVRSLRHQRDDKEAILDNPNFLNQHTDSHSTGLVEITKPTKGESPIRDVKDWNSKTPRFLTDVQNGEIHYYYSPKHYSTNRAKQGMNPEIFSVIRYLTKAFQYDLKISQEDYEKIKPIIENFDPEEIRKNSYASNWLLKKPNGKKIFLHAVNLEKAWNEIEKLGLRKKLIAIEKNPDEVDSLAWLLSKEPLRTKPIGVGNGQLAREIAGSLPKDLLSPEGNIVLSHETNSYVAYESLTRSRERDLNAFISRNGAQGEFAFYGEGFYTKAGRKGGTGSGITIRLELDSNARLGHDFNRLDDIFIINNKAAVKVIPEAINLTLSEYLKLLQEGKSFSSDDKALLHAFRRRLARDGLLEQSEIENIYAVAKKAFSDTRSIPEMFVHEWFSLSLSKKYPEFLKATVASGRFDKWIVQNVFAKPDREIRPELLDEIIKRNSNSQEIIQNVLSSPGWEKTEHFIKWIKEFLDKPDLQGAVTFHVLSKPHLFDHPEFTSLIEQMLKDKRHQILVARILQYPHLSKHPKFNLWVDTLIRNKKMHEQLALSLFLSGAADGNSKLSDWTELLLKKKNQSPLVYQYVLGSSSVQELPKFPKWVDELLTETKADSAIAKRILSRAEWVERRPVWLEQILERGLQDATIAEVVLSMPFSAGYPEIMDTLIRRGQVDREIVYHALAREHWKNHPEFWEKILRKDIRDYDLNLKIELALQESHWQQHPRLLEATKGQPVTIDNLRNAFNSGFSFAKKSTPYKSCSEAFKGLADSSGP